MIFTQAVDRLVLRMNSLGLNNEFLSLAYDYIYSSDKKAGKKLVKELNDYSKLFSTRYFINSDEYDLSDLNAEKIKYTVTEYAYLKACTVLFRVLKFDDSKNKVPGYNRELKKQELLALESLSNEDLTALNTCPDIDNRYALSSFKHVAYSIPYYGGETTYCHYDARKTARNNIYHDEYINYHSSFEIKPKVEFYLTVNKWVDDNSKTLKSYRVDDSKLLSYFQPVIKQFDLYELLRQVDLCCLFNILSAQRREFYSKTTNFSNFLCNYKALDSIDSEKMIELRLTCINAIKMFYQSLNNVRKYFQESNAVLTESVRANFSKVSFDLCQDFLNYIQFIYEIFKGTENGLDEHFYKNCADPRMLFGFYYFYSDLNQLLFFIQKVAFVSPLSLALDDIQQIEKNIAKTISTNRDYIRCFMYEACSKHACVCETLEQTHPEKVDYKSIVLSVLNYRSDLINEHIKLPLATNLHKAKVFCADWLPSYKLFRDKTISSHRNYYCYDNLVFDYQSDYLTLFKLISLTIDCINRYLINVLTFDIYINEACDKDYWYKSDLALVDQAFPIHQKVITHPVFVDLKESHKHCFELIEIILDLNGETNILYAEPYLRYMLELYGTYDEKIAAKFANKKRKTTTLKKGHETTLDLSKAEMLLLDKTMVNFLKEVQTFTNSAYKFLDTSIEEIDSFISLYAYWQLKNKTQAFTIIKILLNLIRYWSYSAFTAMEKKDDELKNNLSDDATFFTNNALNNLFYLRLKETSLVYFNDLLETLSNSTYSYKRFETKESFAKYLPLMTKVFYFPKNMEADRTPLKAIGRLCVVDNKLLSISSILCQRDISQAIAKILAKTIIEIVHLIAILLNISFMSTLHKLTSQKALKEELSGLCLIYSLIKYISFILKDDCLIFLDTTADQYKGNIFNSKEFKDFIYKIYKFCQMVELASKNNTYSRFFQSYITISYFTQVPKLTEFLEQVLTNPNKVVSNFNPLYEVYDFLLLDDQLFIESYQYKDVVNDEYTLYKEINNRYGRVNFVTLSKEIFGDDLAYPLCIYTYIPFGLQSEAVRYKTVKMAPRVLKLLMDNLQTLSEEEMIATLDFKHLDLN